MHRYCRDVTDIFFDMFVELSDSSIEESSEADKAEHVREELNHIVCEMKHARRQIKHIVLPPDRLVELDLMVGGLIDKMNLIIDLISMGHGGDSVSHTLNAYRHTIKDAYHAALENMRDVVDTKWYEHLKLK